MRTLPVVSGGNPPEEGVYTMVGALNFRHILVLLVLIALIVLVVVALIATWRSAILGRAEQVILTFMLVLFPVLGLIAWVVFWATRHRASPRS
jgi:hypothetical protein